ncbi:hypothetical protein [Thalassiella azotivora]
MESAPVVPVLVMALVAAVMVVGAVYSHQVARKRREAFFTWATAHGLRYDRDAPWLVNRWRGTPFGTGRSRRATNAVSGRWDGRDFVAFDYQYTVTRGSGKNRRSHTYRFSVLAVALPAPLSRLEVTPQAIGYGLAKAFGAQDIELESHAFNEAFVVKADSERFAYDVLHPRAQEVLLAGARHGRSLVLGGTDLVSVAPQVAGPAAVVDWLHQADAFLDLVPRFTWQAHGHDPAPASLDDDRRVDQGG